MKIAILGGTFNPLHIGHCMLADSVLCDLKYDKILFVPANIPPHKMMNENVSAEDRFLMIDAFCKSAENYGTERFCAEDCEIKRGGVSYTCDTLQYIIEKYGDKIDGKPALIMGQETAAQFYKWKNADEIAKSADLIIARRNSGFNGIDIRGFTNVPENGYSKDFDNEFSLKDFETQFNSHLSCRYTMLENPLLPISSTEIRARISQGKSWRYLVPDAVYNYIAEHELWGYR